MPGISSTQTFKTLRIFAVTVLFATTGFAFVQALLADHDPSVDYSVPIADLNGDAIVSIFDLSIMLSAWGTSDVVADVTGDGEVSIFDLSRLLSQWGRDDSSHSSDPSPVGQDANVWSYVFNDEFDGSQLNTDVWGYQNGGWNASQVQNCYTPENSQVSGGNLVITAEYAPGHSCFADTKDFTSGFIQTRSKVAWTYGYFESRIKLPASDSVWPAFWMSPNESVYGSWPRSGEIDIFEAKGHRADEVYADAHWGNSGSDKYHRKGTYAIGDFTDWHVYGVAWSEGSLEYYVDGNLYHTVDDFREPNATTHPGPFDQDFYIRLNMAVGGTYLTSPHNDANNSIDQLPAEMLVDYVRVWQ